jgi:hypothetical protein
MLDSDPSISQFRDLPITSLALKDRLNVFLLVLLRIQGLGFKDKTLWPFFARERKSGSSTQGFESLLPGKKHPKLPEITQIWAALANF